MRSGRRSSRTSCGAWGDGSAPRRRRDRPCATRRLAPTLHIPFDPEAAKLVFLLVSSRYERASLIVTSNKPNRFYREVERSGLLEFRELVDRGLRLWEPEILVYFETGLTDGYTEGVTNKVTVIKRTA